MGKYRVEWTDCGSCYRKKLPKKFKRLPADLNKLEVYLRDTPIITDSELKYQDGKVTLFKFRFGIATERKSRQKGLRIYYAEHSNFPSVRLIGCIYFKGDIRQISGDEHLKKAQEREIFNSVVDHFEGLEKDTCS